MKAKDLHERTVEDLKELEKTLSKDLFDARIKNFTNRLDDTASLHRVRRELARIKTVLGQKARSPATPATQKSGAAALAQPAPEAAPSKPAKAKKAAAPKAAKPAKKTTQTEKKA